MLEKWQAHMRHAFEGVLRIVLPTCLSKSNQNLLPPPNLSTAICFAVSFDKRKPVSSDATDEVNWLSFQRRGRRLPNLNILRCVYSRPPLKVKR